jgi:signal transduction histidine kinase
VAASTEAASIGSNILDQSYVHRVLNGEEMVISDVERGSVSGRLEVTASSSVRLRGRIIAIIVTVLNSDDLSFSIPQIMTEVGARFGFVDRNGMLVYRSDFLDIPDENRKIADNSAAWKALNGQSSKAYAQFGYGSRQRLEISIPIHELGWACYVITPTDAIKTKYYNSVKSDILVLILVTLASITLAILLGYVITKPLMRLKQAAIAIMNGDTSVRANIKGRNEIAATAQAFDRMAENIEQNDRLKSQFFSNISHELKTPLNVIYATLQLIMKNYDGNETSEYYKKRQRNLSIIKQNCYRLMKLITNLIDITKYDSGFLKLSPGNHDIVRIVEDITLSIVKYAGNKGITVLFDTDVEEKVIACDPNMIERIMLNLLSNAIKFTDNGGKVIVCITDMKNDKQGRILISVKDSGIGVPEKNLEEIFDRFTQVDSSLTRNNEGSGIGLSLVKSLVTAHKGTISVKSELGIGTEFIVELPATIMDQAEVSEKQVHAQSLVERISIEFSDIYSISDL